MTEASESWPAIVGGFVGAIIGTCFALLAESARDYLHRLQAVQALKDDARAVLSRLDEAELDVSANVANDVVVTLLFIEGTRPRLENRPEWFSATAGTPVLEKALIFFRDARHSRLFARTCLEHGGRDAKWASASLKGAQDTVARVQESGKVLLQLASELQANSSRFDWLHSTFAGPSFWRKSEGQPR